MLNKLWRKTIDFEAIYVDNIKDNLRIRLVGTGQYSPLKNAAHNCFYHLDNDPIGRIATHIVTEWYRQIALSWFIAESRELICAIYFSELGNSPNNDGVMQLSAKSQVIDLSWNTDMSVRIHEVRQGAMHAAWRAYPQYLNPIEEVTCHTPPWIKKNISNAVSKIIELA